MCVCVCDCVCVCVFARLETVCVLKLSARVFMGLLMIKIGKVLGFSAAGHSV